MVRHWYYVVDTGQDWEVRGPDAQACGPGLRYSLQDDAVEAAAQLARAAWRLHHLPAGVRLQSPHGGWVDVRSFGHPDASGAVA